MNNCYRFFWRLHLGENFNSYIGCHWLNDILLRAVNTCISIASSTKDCGLESQWVKFKLFSVVPLFGIEVSLVQYFLDENDIK